MKKDIPLLDDFYNDTAFLTPEKAMDAKVKQDYLTIVEKYNVTSAVLFWGHKPEKVQNIINECELIVDDIPWRSYLWKKSVLLVMLRIGAPIAAGCIEDFKYLGIKTFIAAGTSGCIVKDFDDSNVVVVNRAIRDEGTSYHYLKPSLYVDLDQDIANKLSTFLHEKGVKNVQGTTWTTDAFYRETQKRIEKRVTQGALGVEMECSALAATAKYYNLNFGQFIWFSDKVEAGDWSHLKTKEHRATVKEKLLHLALEFTKEHGKSL